MEIGSVRHKALGAFLETGRARGGLDARLTGRLRNMIAFISAAKDIAELRLPPNFGFHTLSGDRAGVHAMTVTRNWRLTFTLSDDGLIENLDLEDYH